MTSLFLILVILSEGVTSSTPMENPLSPEGRRRGVEEERRGRGEEEGGKERKVKEGRGTGRRSVRVRERDVEREE
jgi:hypothetical protein